MRSFPKANTTKVTCSRNETESVQHLSQSNVRSRKNNTKNHKTKAKAKPKAKTKTRAKTKTKPKAKAQASMNLQTMPMLRGNEQVLFHNSNNKIAGDAFPMLEPGRVFPNSASRRPGGGNFGQYKSLKEGTSKKDNIVQASHINNGKTLDLEDLLEPRPIFEDPKQVDTKKVQSLVPNIKIPPPQLNYDDVLQRLKQRQRVLLSTLNTLKTLKRSSDSVGSPIATGQMVQDNPFIQGATVTPNTNANANTNVANNSKNNANKGNAANNSVENFRIQSGFFQDGLELSRNVVVDYVSDRSYVYTTDIEDKFKLPEFLFLDVPNSTYAARACGQFITNKLIHDLHQKMIHLNQISAKKVFEKELIFEHIVKTCNKSDYTVENIFVPREKIHQKHQTSQDSPSTSCNGETHVQAITARFRLRYARLGTKIHTMLCHNFMNSQECTRGILVFLPCMQANSPADRFWGSLEDVQPLPKIDEPISNAKMDKFCMDIAKRHGTFRGKDPELFGLAVIDRQNNETSNHFDFSSKFTTSTTSNHCLQQARSKPTKNSAAKKTKKGPAAKKKSSAKTKGSLSDADKALFLGALKQLNESIEHV